MKLTIRREWILLVIAMFVLQCGMAIAMAGNFTDSSKKNSVTSARKPKIVFLITKDPDNYEADKTIPEFAKSLQKEFGYDVTVLLGSGTSGSYRYPSLSKLKDADLLVVFARRIALPHEQMETIKSYLAQGKPVIGIRTANHAFTVREKVEEGFEDWPGFVSDILGCQNRGYGPVQPGTDVSIVAEAEKHPIIKGIGAKNWHSQGNVYLVAPLLDTNVTVLLTGKVNEIMQPIAWTRNAGKSKVFYTSLGFPDDFTSPHFTNLLSNAVEWALSP